MSADDAKTRDKGLTIQILGREFRVACPEGEEKQLQASVEYLNRAHEGSCATPARSTATSASRSWPRSTSRTSSCRTSPRKAGASVDGADYRRRIVAMQETLDSALAADQDKLF